MAGFIRRFGSYPGVETITAIEGVVIVDLPPPGAIQGVSTGVVACVGEFADMASAVAVSSTGVVTTKAQPVEVRSGQDLQDAAGGFDATLGNFGLAGGSGFAALRNKKFARLVVVPVNLASGGGGRLWRDLPTNLSATQAQPVVPLVAGQAVAGREFKTGANRVHLGTRHAFGASGHYKNGVDGAVTAAGAPAATQTFNSASGGFLTAKAGAAVQKGDILVVGVIGAGGAQGANAATYRVQAVAAGNTALTVERLDGASFDWTTGTALAYRVHPAADADSAGAAGGQYNLADSGGYRLPCRPLDATVAAATLLAPSVVPPAGTATSWDALSGLAMRSHVSVGFVYDANVQAPNAVNHSSLDALYATAVDALLGEEAPARDVTLLFAARTSATIRGKLREHALAASGVGVGRLAVVSPELSTVLTASATADASPGVGATRAERVLYSWPGVLHSVPEAVGTALGTADGGTTTDGLLDDRGDGWLASVLSNLAPERNPGQSSEPVPTVLAPILGFQRGLGSLSMVDYISLKAAGVCGLRQDRTVGPVFQSGVTSSLTAGQKNVNRRRMADFIQDSVSARLVQFSKEPLTQGLKDAITGEVDAFLLQLLSPTNPAAQRIVSYEVDDKSGNTPALEARGVFVIIGRVRTLATADSIVFQTEIGEGVVITQAA